MKRTIRMGVFETNSSSVHSLTMCLASQYKDWETGKLLFYNDKFYTPEEIEVLKTTEKWFDEDEVQTCDRYWNNIDYESFHETFTTPAGEKVVAFGYYGDNY